MNDNYYPYKKARHWHLKVEFIPHSKLSYTNGMHTKGYDKDHYVIYDEYRIDGKTLQKYELVSYTSDEVKNAEQALDKFKAEVCHGQSRFALKEYQDRCDRVYELYHGTKDRGLEEGEATKKSYRSKLTGDKDLSDPLKIDEIYDEIKEAARVYTSDLNVNDVLTYIEADRLYTSCVEHFNDNSELVNMIDTAAKAKTIADQVYMLDEIEDEIKDHIDNYVKERDRGLDRSLSLY